MKKRHSLLILFLLFQTCHPSLERLTEPEPSFIFANFRPYLYFGQDFNVGIAQPNDPYSLFQYIFDCGIEKKNISIRCSETHTVSYAAKGRIKGILGNRGSGKFPFQETKKVQGWLREGFLLYAPCKEKNNFIKAGYFPFKLGTGLVLGNAYKVNIPIAWQYIYEQIDQFRPGILLETTTQKQRITGQIYLGFTTTSPNFDATISPSLSAFLTPRLEQSFSSLPPTKSVPNIVTAFQAIFSPFEDNSMQISPYFFFQKANLSIEVSNDAISTLYTPGIFGFFKHKNIKLTFELAKNCGKEQIKQLDRNAILNNQIYYDPHPGIAPATVTNNDLILSPFILPSTITTPSGNAGIFTFPVTHSTTYVFKNSYDRFRNKYSNAYAGSLAYADFVITTTHISWTVAALYTSGDNNPNDSYDTILMTRLTPGVAYKDTDKTYKGFLGVDQYYEIGSFNPLYYGTGDFNYSNLVFVGSTFEYRWGISEQPLSAQLTLVTYTKPCSPSFNTTDQTRTTMNNPLGHYLGTEINYSATYANKTKTFRLELLGGIFFPGKYYHTYKQQLASLEAATTLLLPQDQPVYPITDSTKANIPFFISFGCTWLFDLMP